MFALAKFQTPKMKIIKLADADRRNTYICGWLMEHRSFLSVIDEKNLIKIFVKLISLVDLVVDELNERYQENGLTVKHETTIRENARYLAQICQNLRSYGFLDTKLPQ
jgi:hypothetical protein